MKKILKLFLLILVMLVVITPVNAKNKETNLYLFYGDGCPHCEKAKEYLNTIKNNYSNFNIIEYEVWYNKDNQELLNKVKDKLNVKTKTGVPFMVIGDKYIIGFSDLNKSDLKNKIEYATTNNVSDIIAELNQDVKIDSFNKVTEDTTFSLPFIGEVSAKSVSLPVAAILIGAIDGFNPCAMWVLLFLISVLIGMKDRKKMWAIGTTFLFTSALVYMAIMLSWLEIVVNVSTSIWIRNIIAIIAIVGGIVNLNSYRKSKQSGCTVVDDKKRGKIFDRIKKFTHEKNLLLALLGAIGLAISVNLVELACSAGLPLIFIQILAINNITGIMSFIYTLIYIFFFLLDDLIIFIIAMIAMKLTGISTKYSKYSHLVGGILMVIIGILLIFKPEWLMFNFS